MKNETVERSFLQGFHVSNVHEHRAIESVATWKTNRITRSTVGKGKVENFERSQTNIMNFFFSCVFASCVSQNRGHGWKLSLPRSKVSHLISLQGASRRLEKLAEKVGRKLYLQSTLHSFHYSFNNLQTHAGKQNHCYIHIQSFVCIFLYRYLPRHLLPKF